MNIGKRLASKRKEKGYIQKDMPALLDVSDRTYWTYENGAPIPSDVILKLMGLLDISADWLLTGKEAEIAENSDKSKAVSGGDKFTPELLLKMQEIGRQAAKDEFSELLSRHNLEDVL